MPGPIMQCPPVMPRATRRLCALPLLALCLIAGGKACAQTPLDAAPALPDTTTQLAAFTQEMADSAEHALDAELAADVLAGLGRATGLADIGTPLLTHKASPAPSPFKAKAPPAVLADASAPRPIAELANQRFGTAQGLALQVSQRFASSSAFATDVALAHAAGPLDIRFDLTGNKALSGGSPMALSYASSALVAVGPVLTLGMVAHGDLGTTNALAPSTDQIAGPVAKLRLLGQRASLNAETGYNFHVMPGNAPALQEFPLVKLRRRRHFGKFPDR